MEHIHTVSKSDFSCKWFGVVEGGTNEAARDKAAHLVKQEEEAHSLAG